MHLSILSFTDLRQFEKRTFEFSPGFNLLVGENGAGKSTIIRGLVAAVGDLRSVRRDLKIGDEDIRLGREQAIVEADVHFSDSYIENYLFEKPLWRRAKRSPRGSTRPLVLSYASNEAVCRSMKVKQVKRFQGDKYDNYRREEEYLYFGSDSRSPNDRPSLNGKRFGNSQQVQEFVGKVLSAFSPDFEDFYWRFEPYGCLLIPPKNAEKEIPIDENLQKKLQTAAMRFFQESRLRKDGVFRDWPDQSEVVLGGGSKISTNRELDLLFREAWETLDLPPSTKRILRDSLLKVKLTPRIMIMHPIGPLSLSQLSDGEQRLFSLFVDIARNLSLQDEFDGIIGSGNAIVLIDEIDVHLHPKWQRQIVPLLEDLFPNCQFIATTHSPFVIQSMRDGKLISLDREIEAEYANQNIEDVAEDIMNVEIPQRSKRYVEMMKIASQYYRTLRAAGKDSNVDVLELKMKLDAISVRYSNDPFFAANLDFQWETFVAKKEVSES